MSQLIARRVVFRMVPYAIVAGGMVVIMLLSAWQAHVATTSASPPIPAVTLSIPPAVPPNSSPEPPSAMAGDEDAPVPALAAHQCSTGPGGARSPTANGSGGSGSAVNGSSGSGAGGSVGGANGGALYGAWVAVLALSTMILLRLVRRAAAKPVWRVYLPEVPPA
jgi:uncharacterized membrane protein YgcG